MEHTGWRVRKDGTRFWGDVVITALRDDAGRLTGYAKVTRDRTDLKTLEDAQDAFYAGFQPRLPHPGHGDQRLRRGHPRGRRRPPGLPDRPGRGQRRPAARHGGGLVEFARQRAGHAVLDLDDGSTWSPWPVRRCATCPRAWGRTGCACTDAVALGRANVEAMHRVLTNLVVNALKYIRRHRPVDVTFDDTRPGRVVGRVSDHGRGIDPDDLATIFDEFGRGRLATDDGGSGLGLASVRELVREQDGTRARSTASPGSAPPWPSSCPRPPAAPPSPRERSVGRRPRRRRPCPVVGRPASPAG